MENNEWYQKYMANNDSSGNSRGNAGRGRGYIPVPSPFTNSFPVPTIYTPPLYPIPLPNTMPQLNSPNHIVPLLPLNYGHRHNPHNHSSNDNRNDYNHNNIHNNYGKQTARRSGRGQRPFFVNSRSPEQMADFSDPNVYFLPGFIPNFNNHLHHNIHNANYNINTNNKHPKFNTNNNNRNIRGKKPNHRGNETKITRPRRGNNSQSPIINRKKENNKQKIQKTAILSDEIQREISAMTISNYPPHISDYLWVLWELRLSKLNEKSDFPINISDLKSDWKRIEQLHQSTYLKRIASQLPYGASSENFRAIQSKEIYPYFEEIKNAITESNHIIVQGESGVGKSSLGIVYIIESLMTHLNNNSNRINKTRNQNNPSNRNLKERILLVVTSSPNLSTFIQQCKLAYFGAGNKNVNHRKFYFREYNGLYSLKRHPSDSLKVLFCDYEQFFSSNFVESKQINTFHAVLFDEIHYSLSDDISQSFFVPSHQNNRDHQNNYQLFNVLISMICSENKLFKTKSNKYIYHITKSSSSNPSSALTTLLSRFLPKQSIKTVDIQSPRFPISKKTLSCSPDSFFDVCYKIVEQINTSSKNNPNKDTYANFPLLHQNYPKLTPNNRKTFCRDKMNQETVLIIVPNNEYLFSFAAQFSSYKNINIIFPELKSRNLHNKNNTNFPFNVVLCTPATKSTKIFSSVNYIIDCSFITNYLFDSRLNLTFQSYQNLSGDQIECNANLLNRYSESHYYSLQLQDRVNKNVESSPLPLFYVLQLLHLNVNINLIEEISLYSPQAIFQSIKLLIRMNAITVLNNNFSINTTTKERKNIFNVDTHNQADENDLKRLYNSLEITDDGELLLQIDKNDIRFARVLLTAVKLNCAEAICKYYAFKDLFYSSPLITQISTPSDNNDNNCSDSHNSNNNSNNNNNIKEKQNGEVLHIIEIFEKYQKMDFHELSENLKLNSAKHLEFPILQSFNKYDQLIDRINKCPVIADTVDNEITETGIDNEELLTKIAKSFYSAYFDQLVVLNEEYLEEGGYLYHHTDTPVHLHSSSFSTFQQKSHKQYILQRGSESRSHRRISRLNSKIYLFLEISPTLAGRNEIKQLLPIEKEIVELNNPHNNLCNILIGDHIEPISDKKLLTSVELPPIVISRIQANDHSLLFPYIHHYTFHVRPQQSSVDIYPNTILLNEQAIEERTKQITNAFDIIKKEIIEEELLRKEVVEISKSNYSIEILPGAVTHQILFKASSKSIFQHSGRPNSFLRFHDGSDEEEDDSDEDSDETNTVTVSKDPTVKPFIQVSYTLHLKYVNPSLSDIQIFEMLSPLILNISYQMCTIERYIIPNISVCPHRSLFIKSFPHSPANSINFVCVKFIGKTDVEQNSIILPLVGTRIGTSAASYSVIAQGKITTLSFNHNEKKIIAELNAIQRLKALYSSQSLLLQSQSEYSVKLIGDLVIQNKFTDDITALLTPSKISLSSNLLEIFIHNSDLINILRDKEKLYKIKFDKRRKCLLVWSLHSERRRTVNRICLAISTFSYLKEDYHLSDHLLPYIKNGEVLSTLLSSLPKSKITYNIAAKKLSLISTHSDRKLFYTLIESLDQKYSKMDDPVSLNSSMEMEIDKNGKECAICCHEMTLQGMFRLSLCAHSFCKKCLRDQLNYSVNARKFPICCILCQSPFAHSDFLSLSSKLTMEKCAKFSLENYVSLHSSRYLRCPTPDCSGIFSLSSSQFDHCRLCSKSFCLLCFEFPHFSLSCEENKKMIYSSLDDKTNEYFNTLLENKQAQRCPKCKCVTVRIDGCNYMTCYCSQSFCLMCGAPLHPSKEFSHFHGNSFGSKCLGLSDASPLSDGHTTAVSRPAANQRDIFNFAFNAVQSDLFGEVRNYNHSSSSDDSDMEYGNDFDGGDVYSDDSEDSDEDFHHFLRFGSDYLTVLHDRHSLTFDDVPRGDFLSDEEDTDWSDEYEF